MLRQLGYFPAGSYLYKRSVFSKIRRVRIVPQHPEQVISSAVRKGLPRRINQTRAMHHVKAMARPRKYTRYKYRRSLLRCKASTKRTRRRTSRRLRSQRRILPRRIGR